VRVVSDGLVKAWRRSRGEPYYQLLPYTDSIPKIEHAPRTDRATSCRRALAWGTQNGDRWRLMEAINTWPVLYKYVACVMESVDG